MSNTNSTSDLRIQNQKPKLTLEDDRIPKASINMNINRSSDQRQHQMNEFIYNQKQRQQVNHASQQNFSSQNPNHQNCSSQNTQQQASQMISTVLRQGSQDKIVASNFGSTGGSQSFTVSISKKPQLKLSSNLINHSSIVAPQTTSNLHSSRMINYQNPHLLNSNAQYGSLKNLNQHSSNRTGITTSTPKTQTSSSNQSQSQNSHNQNYQQQHQSHSYSSSLLLQAKHRQQASNSQIKQGLQGSQAQGNIQQNQGSSLLANISNALGGIQDIAQKIINNSNSNNQGSQIQSNQQTQNEIVKVGTQIPKTTTAASLRNYNNLRQFNQIFSSKNTHHKNQKSIINMQGIDSQEQNNQQNSQNNSERVQPQISSTLLQNHQRHLQQQSSRSNLLKHQGKQKSISQAIQEQTLQLNQKQVKPKNLEIAIPSSPRPEDQHEENTKQLQNQQQFLMAKGQLHSGSLSTTNQNQGNIKLSKFTCNSTRNQSQKQNIFSQQSIKPTQQDNKQNPQTLNQNQEQSHKQLDINNPDTMPLQPAHKIIIPNHESTKHSVKRNGVVRAYAANTNQGLVRNYNEDRVSIILNILKPPNRKDEHWPRCSFFGIYDGHGGSACADFLRDNLHQFVIKEPCFPSDPKEALSIGFANAEKKFMELCQNENGIINKSGSCAIVALIVEDMCYIANVGDSRAILSCDQGQKIVPLSRDHKPCDEHERKRIIEAGGQIYHRTATTNTDAKDPSKKEIVVGPLRVLPGRLSVSRTFGDAEAKIQKFGGNPNVVIAIPEIRSFKISSEQHDFVVLGCDGIFDKLSNQDTISCVWNSVEDNKQLAFAQNIHKQSGMAVEYILKNSLLRRTLDNVTVVMIAFNNFKHAVFGSTKDKKSKIKNGKPTSISNQRSNENSLALQQQNIISKVTRKENIPPQQQLQSQTNLLIESKQVKKSSLGIITNTNCTSQGPKTTTNAQLQKENLNREGTISYLQNQNQHQNVLLKKSNIGITSNNSKARHFDFTNV